jgi:hypothetical protein
MPYVQQRAQAPARGDRRGPAAGRGRRPPASASGDAPAVRSASSTRRPIRPRSCATRTARSRAARPCRARCCSATRGGLLPLDPARLRRLAVIGRLAATKNLGDGGSSNVHPPHVVTPLDGLRAALPDATIVHDDGGNAAAVAADAERAIVVVGYTHHDEGEFIDRTAWRISSPVSRR